MNHDDVEHAVAESLQESADALWPRGVFGEPQTFGEVTIIPVARVTGGVGSGGGDGSADSTLEPGLPESGRHGSGGAGWFGFGSMLGVGAHPVGVYEIRDGVVRWRPSVDVDRLARHAQVLVGVLAVCASLVAVTTGRRRRR